MADDQLVRDLVALGRGADVAAPSEGLAGAVLRRVADPPTRRTAEWWTRRRRLAALVVVAIVVGLLATPPVRAAVADWFGFGAVRVEPGGAGTSDPAPPPPDLPVAGRLSEAAALVGFPVSAPAGLGDPDGVEVSPDRRRVSMSWTTDDAGVLRLDQFDARLDYSVVKRTPGVTFVGVDGGDALWFEEPHEVALIDADGTQVTHSARLAGHTLIWQDGATTLRLEGDIDLGRAIRVAESSEPVG
ncbi:hypothetical protein [Nocardioides sp. YIM 152315]|uniref:hypothetical protein n=1 Tax=Nocardioides sp. YIM 152315 TaxID=3031760 RepID=UPI0023DBBB5E|nr:hypothetical protein [Nocardioides sp. YIM 152315]MDF1602150.1 hypothetical protein [Nocardioides sp. YIM 152315]